ncbi:peptidoglycan DL-endopeptidase LytF [Microdochium nivale]|nr:peptidoglycan DL-endopeptidase LytF [Microdochium nivale]
MLFSKLSVLAAVAAPRALAHVVKRQSMPHDPNSSPYCSWYIDSESGETCNNVLNTWGLSMADFVRWNPSLTSTCGNFKTGVAYCVEVTDEPAVPSTQPPTTQPPTTTSKPPSTTAKPTTTSSTKPSNGIETPSPVQEGISASCNKFHLVETGTSCSSILTKYNINLATFYSWNKAVGSQCESMWAEVYVCVGVIGGSQTTAKPTTTSSTKPSNGIETPSPVQDGISASCNKFHYVESGTSCSSILTKYSLNIATFYSWNKAVGSNCESMWAEVYVCVGIIGGTPTTTKATTTTTAGNGITTPTPTQGGMINDCDKWDYVKKGETCSAILSRNGLTVAQLYALNSGVGNNCQGLWAEVYVCVHKKGTATTKPPTTTAGNGITTPTPTQSGMVSNCRKFALVKTGDTCDSVAKANGVSVANFTTWNKAYGSNCSGMWANTYACVGV